MDHPALFAICAFLTLMVALSFIGYRVFYKPGKFLKQLGRPVITNERRVVLAETSSEPETRPIVSFLQTLGAKMPTSGADAANLKTALSQAGYRSENAVAVFYGIRILATLVMVVVSFMVQARMSGNPAMTVALVVMGAGMGWMIPRTRLEKQVKKRQEIMRLSLPDALDLMVVSIEAGLGLDQAIQHVARELGPSHPQLSEELTLVTLEMRAGKRRADALRNLSERTGEEELRKLVAILVQNDRFGTSMGESLRTHSDFMRTRRKQDAEERAGKVGVKLVFPIFFFILPSMLIVAAGPGILQIFKYLFPMMKKLG
jgi:tight adherence protein C